MIYKSKIDWWLGLLLFGVIPCISIAVPIYGYVEGKSTDMYIGLGVLGFFVFIIFGLAIPMQYIVEENGLVVRHGLLRQKISYEQIQGISPSSNPLSSPALSLDRLSINYGKSLPLLISPKDKAGFLKSVAERATHLKIEGESLVKA